MRHIFVGQNFARISNFIFILRLDAISAFERFGLDVNGGTAEYIWTMRRNSEIVMFVAVVEKRIGADEHIVLVLLRMVECEVNDEDYAGRGTEEGGERVMDLRGR